MKADEEDVQNGEELTSLLEFILQHYLRRCKTRQEAAISLYRLIRSMREHHTRNALVHLTARFLNLVDERSGVHKATVTKDTKRYTASNAAMDMTFLVVYTYMRHTILSMDLDFTPSTGPSIRPSPLSSQLQDFPKFAAILGEAHVWVPLEVGGLVDKEATHAAI